MRRVLIDTDVILDFFFDRKPFSDFSGQIFGLCETKKIKGFVTPVVISNTYYILRQKFKHEKVILSIKKLLTLTDVLIMNKEVVMSALNSDFKGFEDALQNFSATGNGKIDTIITRNIKDFKNSELVVFCPESFVKSM